MNRPKDGTISSRIVITRAALAFVVAAAPIAFAKHPRTKSSDKPASVIAHIALPGAPSMEKLLQQRGDHEYRYIVRNSKKGFTIVDVTNPRKPEMLERVSWPNEASAGQLEVVGNRLGIAEGADGTSAAEAPPPRTETVELLDLSDPANPCTIQTFNGVTSVLTDSGRHMIYVANSDGLWVVRQNQRVQVPACTTADATALVAACN